MPITVERLEARIYRCAWIDFVSIEDVRAALLRRQELADDDGARSYVAIVDVIHAGSVPSNLESVQPPIGAESRLIELIVVGTNIQARILVESLTKVAQSKLESAYSVEEALKRAHMVLEEFDSSVS